MSDNNKTYRIKTNINSDTNLNIKLDQSYDAFQILSLELGASESYRLHDSNYGVIVGRVLANNGFGIENAKISVFISADTETLTDSVLSSIYGYMAVYDKNEDGVRYNLLSDEKLDECHQVVGTFPDKRYVLSNDAWIEVFDKYYKYTVRTNHAGDYMLCGVPVGVSMLHMDLDLSDCGILSQRPRDFVYKGYTIEQFENPNQFKTSKELNTLSQIFTEDVSVNVNPFWGNKDEGETIGITRHDFNIPFTFEPTCVFIGSVISDNSSNGISKKCVPSDNMGEMDEIVTGEGTIEMIRKTPSNDVEEFQIKGTELIDGNGVWCYQIPMNLDYVKHDEYGNIVPTNNPNEGIPTRARVRFRISMNDFEENTDNFFRGKVLVPHNPKKQDELDYVFGTNTKEESYRDLFWNNVYTVKSYIPRFQRTTLVKGKRFTGIKHTNIYGQNNPMPYNNIRIHLPFMFTVMCALIKTYIRIVTFINWMIYRMVRLMAFILSRMVASKRDEKLLNYVKKINYVLIADGLCPDLDG